MNWINIAMLLLQLANKLTDWASEQKAISEGEQREIARQSAEILRKTQVGREIFDRLHQLDDSALDDQLRDLEPKE